MYESWYPSLVGAYATRRARRFASKKYEKLGQRAGPRVTGAGRGGAVHNEASRTGWLKAAKRVPPYLYIFPLLQRPLPRSGVVDSVCGCVRGSQERMGCQGWGGQEIHSGMVVVESQSLMGLTRGWALRARRTA